MKKINSNPVKRFIASVEEDDIKNIAKIANKLKLLGCDIDDIHKLTGVILGSTSNPLESLQIEGVEHVEIDRTVKAFKKQKTAA